MPIDDDIIRSTALNLIMRIGEPPPTAEVVAERTGLPLERVQSAYGPDEHSLFNYLLQPFTEAMDNELKQLPLHNDPTIPEQRQILDAIITAALATPDSTAFMLWVLADSRVNDHHGRKVDRLAYQAGVRLLGTEYDQDPDQMSRVYFAGESLCMSVVSRRHDFHDLHHRSLFIDSLIGILHPPTFEPPKSRARRWSDPTG